MTRRFAIALAIIGLLASACGSGSAVGALTREVTAQIDETRTKSRTYRYVDEGLDGEQRIVVDGKLQDDLRYQGTVSIDGKKVYEQIVSDDSVALRLLDTEMTKDVIAAAERADKITADALRAGRWVVDHTVAPPLLAAAAALEEEGEQTADRPDAGRRRTNIIGDDPFIDSAQVLNYTERVVRSSFRVEQFNPEDINYNPLDDPWASDKEADLEDQGIRRYDLLLPPLPPPAQRGQQQNLPTVEHFRKMALYVKGEVITEIREQISISDRREFRRAEQGRGADFYLELRDGALDGAIQDELRQRKMRYIVEDLGDVEVALPTDAVEGLLADALKTLKDMYEFEFIGGRGGMGGIPGAGGGSLVTPGPGGSPAVSPGAGPAGASPAAETSPAPGTSPAGDASPTGGGAATPAATPAPTSTPADGGGPAAPTPPRY